MNSGDSFADYSLEFIVAPFLTQHEVIPTAVVKMNTVKILDIKHRYLFSKLANQIGTYSVDVYTHAIIK